MSKAKVIVWKSDHNRVYPWMFTVEFDGRRYEFAGAPNYCETRRQAAIRGWWRKKWLEDGTFDKRYT